MCGLYYPHPSNTIFISKEIKDDAEGENAYEENEDKLQVKTKSAYLPQNLHQIWSMYADDDLQKMRCCSSPLQNNHSAEAFPHALNSKDAPHPLFFSPVKYPLSQKCQKVLWSPILSPFILIPLSAFKPPGFLPLHYRNPLHQHGNHTPHYFSCTHEANSLPSVFSLLHHQESIWIRGGLQGSQTKA